MKLKFILSLSVTVLLVYALNRSWGTIPPLGKFLDPFHGFWKNAATSKMESPDLQLPGLKAEVSVVYDSVGIPHIFAKNDDDLYYAQGYITAKDRLWQMEFQTHSGAGRIAEIVGNLALDYDRGQRRMGMTMAAANALKTIENDPVAKSMTDSYTQGINAYIATLRYELLPLEYKLLNYEPEEWTNLKSAILLVNMARTLNAGEKDLAMTNVLSLFGKETVDLLFPDYENSGDPIVDTPGKWNFKPVTLDSIPLAVPDALKPSENKKEKAFNPSSDNLLINFPVEKFNPDVGSNNWAVSGSRTKSGSPMLCNDPHLNLSLPSIWYVIHLNAPGINTMGASLPGAPAVVSGFNDSIAWGVTNAQRDLVDWYKIQFKDGSKNEYFSDGKWKSTRKVIEKFIVRNGEVFYDTIVFTHHGPVRFDESFHAKNELRHFAYHWVSFDAGLEFLACHGLNRARNHADYMNALNHWKAPAQNFVFAAVNGDIAMRIQGQFPVRRKDEGKYVLDGTRTSQEWKAMIPNDQNIMYKNPERGFISSANQYPADITYPYYINGDSWEAYRNRRINQILGALHNGVPQDMMKLQLDNYNLKAAEVLPLFLSYLDPKDLSPVELAAYQKLKDWDFYNTIDAEAPAYYDAWWRAFYPMLWHRLMNAGKELDLPTSYTTIRLIHEHPDLPFFDNDSTTEKETSATFIRASFTKGLKTIAKWKEDHKTASLVRWADYKDTFVGHLLMGMPALSYHVQHGGGADIVDASTHTHGPSWRMIVSLEKTGVQAWGVYPGGESGNPGSPYYNNMIDRWAKGNYFKFHFTTSQNMLQNYALATTTLKPSAK